MTKRILTALCLVLTMFFYSVGLAYGYTVDYYEKFYYTGPYYGSPYFAYLYSPFRDGSNNERYPYVTSKYNNPRPLTSSPHGSVDFGVDIGTPVYPLSNGQVTYVNSSIDPSFGKYVIIRLDVNRDGTLDNVWARYAHLNKIFISQGASVSIDTLIGESGSTGTTAAHLHVDLRDNNNSNTGVYHHLPWREYYNNRWDWNTGKDLDWMSGHSVSNRTFSVYCYGKTDGGVNITPSEVKLWVRKAGSSDPWRGYTMSHAGDYKYTVTVPSVDFPDGTTVEYFYSGKRGEVDESSYCPYGLYPAKFKAPAIPPSSTVNFAKYSHIMGW